MRLADTYSFSQGQVMFLIFENSEHLKIFAKLLLWNCDRF